MKKTIHPIICIALAVVAVLSASSVFALSGDNELSTHAEATDVTSAVAADDAKATINTTVPMNDMTVPLSESLDRLAKNPNFNEHGFIISTLPPAEDGKTEITTSDAQIIEKTVAVETALEKVRKMTKSSPELINAVLANFSDTENPVLPESNVSLSNIPVWIVTFEGIEILRGGPQLTSETILADVNVVIDAYSGQILETFSYPAG